MKTEKMLIEILREIKELKKHIDSLSALIPTQNFSGNSRNRNSAYGEGPYNRMPPMLPRRSSTADPKYVYELPTTDQEPLYAEVNDEVGHGGGAKRRTNKRRTNKRRNTKRRNTKKRVNRN